MMSLKVWWVKCGHGHGNFGDNLTKNLLDKLCNIKVEHVHEFEDATLIGIGSVLDMLPMTYSGYIWTSGAIDSKTILDFPKANIIALRGVLSAKKVNRGGNIVMGDGGLLCNYLDTKKVLKTKRLGIIPHYVDINNSHVLALSKQPWVSLIDICDDYQRVIAKVKRCHYIVSSSLHGLILADSCGIPNRRFDVGGNIVGDGFKYDDYYSIYPNVDKNKVSPINLANKRVEHIIKEIEDYDRTGIEGRKEELLQTFENIIALL